MVPFCFLPGLTSGKGVEICHELKGSSGMRGQRKADGRQAVDFEGSLLEPYMKHEEQTGGLFQVPRLSVTSLNRPQPAATWPDTSAMPSQKLQCGDSGIVWSMLNYGNLEMQYALSIVYLSNRTQ